MPPDNVVLPDLGMVDPDQYFRHVNVNPRGDIQMGVGNESKLERRVNPFTKDSGWQASTQLGDNVRGSIRQDQTDDRKFKQTSGQINAGPAYVQASKNTYGTGFGAGVGTDVGGGRLSANYNRFVPKQGPASSYLGMNYRLPFANGGSVNPQGIASLGRGQDSMLVHMTPREVSGLQSLAKAHGGSLTINPKTGLPEAGFLDSMLPTVIGFGLNAAFPGLGALGAGLLTGAGYGLLTGNLGKGLMAGIGAYGGAGLGGALESSGLNAIQNNAVENSLANNIDLASINEMPVPAGGWDKVPTSFDDMYANINAPQINALQNTGLAQQNVALAQFDAAKQAAQSAGKYAGENAGYLQKLTAGAKGAFDQPKQFLGQTLTGPGTTGFSNKTNLMMAAAPLAMFSMQPNTLKGIGSLGQGGGNFYNTKFAQGTPNPNYGKPGHEGEPPILGQGYYGGSFSPTYQPQEQVLTAANGGLMQGTYPGAAIPHKINDGGLLSYAQGGVPENAVSGSPSRDAAGIFDDSMRPLRSMSVVSLFTLAHQGSQMAKNELKMREQEGEPVNPDADPYATQKAAQGGLMGLQDEYAAGGRLLNGPGDGMSDSIPAVIKGEKPQRAALADGEFVVPADVVSHLGNGSTNAGAKHLYSMMDRVRKARTGNPKQGKEINPQKFMPA